MKTICDISGKEMTRESVDGQHFCGESKADCPCELQSDGFDKVMEQFNKIFGG